MRKTQYKKQEGYLAVKIDSDETIEIEFELPVIEWRSHPLVKNNLNKVAIQRGPFIYCLEEEDNGSELHLVNIIEKPKPVDKVDKTLGKFVELKGKAERQLISSSWQEQLYVADRGLATEETELSFIPYYLWANRSIGEMNVWINRK